MLCDTSLRTFFRTRTRPGTVAPTPRAWFVAPCADGTARERSRDDEQGRLLQALAAGVGPEARRDHALFALMLATGIRLG
jgi:site-specific recombinase XerC